MEGHEHGLEGAREGEDLRREEWKGGGGELDTNESDKLHKQGRGVDEGTGSAVLRESFAKVLAYQLTVSCAFCRLATVYIFWTEVARLRKSMSELCVWCWW